MRPEHPRVIATTDPEKSDSNLLQSEKSIRLDDSIHSLAEREDLVVEQQYVAHEVVERLEEAAQPARALALAVALQVDRVA